MTASTRPGALPGLLALMSLPLVVQGAVRLSLWGVVPERIPLRWEGGEAVWTVPTDAAFAVAALLVLAGVGVLAAELRAGRRGRRSVLTVAGLAASLPATIWCGSLVATILAPPVDGVFTVGMLLVALLGTGYGLIPRAWAHD
ncbi:hypothetical protein [Protaetiibacter larvae]|uniref:Uncharacterized protein n=1 Tax=Protaetiibacter larvae TaxID=2592654 RepID=A0A5C1Y630_9MICO|nr:hypothetical protein [Protaetiibacter larvae]QEO08868.1 hypothetical protein FLP23_01835 [Protaetiibacter larvae]